MRRGSGILALAAALAASPSQALTMEEALAEAARSNPTVRAAREAARAGHQEVPLAHGAWLPTLRTGAGTMFTRTGSLNRDSGERSVDLTWTQTLYHGGRHLAGLRRAESEVLQRHATVEDTEQSVLLRAATAYLDVLRATRTVTLHNASLAAFEARQNETRAQFRIGDRTQADVAQADAEREEAAADLAAARADLENQRALFELLVGRPADGLEAAGEPAGLPGSLEAAQRMARADRPAVRAAVHAERAAAHAVRVASGEIGPRFDLSGEIRRTTGYERGVPDSTDMSAGLRMTLPLYQAGAAGARLRQARRLRAERRDQLLAAEREAFRLATSAWNDLDAARLRHAALLAATRASGLALANVRREADIGERTTREVLDAERDLVSRRVRALSAERDTLVGAYRLLDAVGALTARNLGIDGVPDLEGEARRTRWDVLPGALSVVE